MSEQIESQKRIEKITGNRQAAHFGDKFRGACLSRIRLESSETHKIADFLKNRKNMLIYCGGVGIGKTYLCAAMMAHALEHFQTSRAWDMNDLLGKIRSTMDSSGDYLENMKYFIDDDFVIIDDLGNCEMNPWRKDMISYIIDKRYQSARPTVITSNFSIREFSEIFHPRVSSRLFAKENYVIERMDAPDLRQEGM